MERTLRTVEIDVPIEVTKEEYDAAVKHYSGYIFHRTENNRYWIKIGISHAIKGISRILK